MQKEAFEDILDQEFERMPAYGDILGRLKIAICVTVYRMETIM